MKKFFVSLLSVSLLVGCHKPEEKHSEENSSVEGAPTYKEGKGISLSKISKTSIGLNTVAVSEKQIVPQFTTEVQVYQKGNETTDALAAGYITPEYAAKLKISQAVKLKSEKGGQELIGKLSRLDAQAKNSTGQIEAIVSISDAAGKLSNGDSLQATFSTGEKRTAIVVPRSALLQSTEGDFVYVENGEHFMRSAVKVGEAFDDSLEILDGLYEGDVVVVSGLQPLWLAELRFVKGGQACGH